MKTLKHLKKTAGVFFIGTLALTSCQENIDTSDLYTFTGETVSSLLSQSDSLGHYYELLNTVRQTSY